jgi:hypothetical protein
MLSNGSSNKHVSTEKIAQQQNNGVFYTVRADILKTDVRGGIL